MVTFRSSLHAQSPSMLPPVKRQRSAGRPSWQQLWERTLQKHILHHHELPHGVRLQPGWWRPGVTIAPPLTHEEIVHSSLAAPTAALVEDEPNRSTAKRRKVHADFVVRDWFLDMMEKWKTQRRWDMQRRLCDVQRLCPRMYNGISRNAPYRWKRSVPRPAPLRRHDTAERAHLASDRRPVPRRADDQELGTVAPFSRSTKLTMSHA